MRYYVFIHEATTDSLTVNIDEFLVSKSLIQRIQTERRKEQGKTIKINFQL